MPTARNSSQTRDVNSGSGHSRRFREVRCEPAYELTWTAWSVTSEKCPVAVNELEHFRKLALIAGYGNSRGYPLIFEEPCQSCKPRVTYLRPWRDKLTHVDKIKSIIQYGRRAARIASVE
jgi:hypothetical protein